MFSTCRALKELLFKLQKTVCSHASTTMDVSLQTLLRFLDRMEMYRVTCFPQTSTTHPTSSKRIIISITTALWRVKLNSVVNNSFSSFFAVKTAVLFPAVCFFARVPIILGRSAERFYSYIFFYRI